MWRNCRADRCSSRMGRRAGFTLLEAMVSLIILVIVMVVVLSLLFSMKSFAEKQQAFTAPRQTARRALDYVAQTLEGAGDWNQVTTVATMPTPGHYFALVMFWEKGTSVASTRQQASYNNLTGAEPGNGTFTVNNAAPASSKVTSTNFGTVGTDIISVAFPSAQTGPVKIPIARWAGAPATAANSVDVYLDFALGCGVDPADPYNAANAMNVDDEGNIKAFQRAVGGPWAETIAGGGIVSSLVIIADGNGNWRLAQLTGLNAAGTYTNSATISSDCTKKRSLSPASNATEIIHATLKDASKVAPEGQGYFPPGGWRTDLLPSPQFLIAGIDFVSFRHQTVLDPTDPAHTRVFGQLQQKASGINSLGAYTPGFFDPSQDGSTATTMFTPIVDNVDDFQVAYIMSDGYFYNTSAQVFDNGGTHVPYQAQTPGSGGVDCTHPPLATTNLDAACVVGLRVSIVGRSLPMTFGSKSLTGAGFQTPSGESRSRRLPVEDHVAGTVDDTAASGVYDRLRLTTTIMLRNRALGF